jgi:hypothetical protein
MKPFWTKEIANNAATRTRAFHVHVSQIGRTRTEIHVIRKHSLIVSGRAYFCRSLHGIGAKKSNGRQPIASSMQAAATVSPLVRTRNRTNSRDSDRRSEICEEDVCLCAETEL